MTGASSDRAAWRLHHFDGEHLAAVDDWLTTPGRSRAQRTLLLAGATSTGKTSLACAIAHEWWQGGARPVIFATVDADDLLRTDPPALGPLGPDTLVILDELSPMAIHWPSFTSLVNRLDRARCRIITTTNLLPSALRDDQQVDPRVRSRLTEGLVIPLTERLSGSPPELPGGGPCPYHCETPGLFAMGHLANCDIPEVADLVLDFIENEMQGPGLAPWYGLHRPDRADYRELDVDEGDHYFALAQAKWSAAFDHHATETGHWCPHCRPEMVKRDGWLARRLAELGHPLAS
jgi:hypothetical protein